VLQSLLNFGMLDYDEQIDVLTNDCGLGMMALAMVAVGEPLHELQMDCRGSIVEDTFSRSYTISAGEIKFRSAKGAPAQLNRTLDILAHVITALLRPQKALKPSEKESKPEPVWTIVKRGYLFTPKSSADKMRQQLGSGTSDRCLTVVGC
jgi:hypothetical protein